MFRVPETPIVKWPTVINVPQDGGKVKQWEVTLHLELILNSDWMQIYESGEKDQGMLRRVVRGWEPGDFENRQGEKIAFSPEALTEQCDIPYVRVSIINAIVRARSGQEAIRKN